MYIAERELRSVAEAATKVVKKAGEIIVNSLGSSHEIRHKGEIDLVTEVDIEVEEYLKGSLRKVLDADFLAEESASLTLSDAPTWVIDPLDGTTNFAHAIPVIATSVALCVEGLPYVGIINLPVLGETFYAIRGKGAWLNEKKIHVSSTSSLKQALVATGFPYDISTRVEEVIPPLQRVLVSVQGVRRMGAAAVDLAYVACGRFDGFFEQGLKPWDIAAGILLVKEAGGEVSEYHPHHPISLFSPNILASNGIIHEHLSRILL